MELLDREHQAYVKKEGLNMKNEPEKSYLKGFNEKVNRAVEIQVCDGATKFPARRGVERSSTRW